ncbi:MAG: hypothetical protein V8Q30_02555 [Acutalibacteraceae bacterium]
MPAVLAGIFLEEAKIMQEEKQITAVDQINTGITVGDAKSCGLPHLYPGAETQPASRISTS